MPRGLSGTLTTALAEESKYVFNLVELYFSSTYRYTDAHAEIQHDFGDGEGNKTYLASPNLVSIGAVNETEKLHIGSMVVAVNAVNQTLLAMALSEDIVNREVRLYRGLLDTGTYAVIDDPTLIYRGKIKSFSMQESVGATSTLSFNTASTLADFERNAGRRTNQQDQLRYLEFTSESTGFATSAHAGTQLTDTAANFILNETVRIGGIVTNTDDGNSVGVVTGVTSPTVLTMTTLSGGTNDDWEVNDDYTIVAPVDLGFEFTSKMKTEIWWGAK